MKKYIFIFLCLSFLLPWNVLADTHTAASCQDTAIQTAVDAAADGDTVAIPACVAGTVLWTNATGGVHVTDKQLTIQGAGTDASTGTNINYTIGSALFHVDNSTNKTFRITAMRFVSSSRSTQTEYLIWVNKSTNRTTEADAWRIDHLKFDITGAYNHGLVWAYGYQRGLVDHIEFNRSECGGSAYQAASNSPFLVTQGYEDEAGTYPTDILGHNAWLRDPAFGTDHFVFAEDNTINYEYSTYCYGDITDSNSGGKFVFRHNTVGNVSNWLMLESHSACSSGWRGNQAFEIYENTISMPSGTGNPPIKMRGGTGLVFNNEMPTGGSRMVGLDVERAVRTNCNANLPICDGTRNLDGNLTNPATGTVNGWPCLDQVGFGMGAPQSQTAMPVYIWGNTKAGSALNTVYVPSGTEQTFVVNNREYFAYNASFNGTSGVGVGTLADRPGTCESAYNDLTGRSVSYYATDTQTLYKCTADNTWTAYYTPYTYPHPLQSESDTTAPTNIAASNSIDNTGLILNLGFSESVKKTGTAAITMTCSGGAVTPTYSTGTNSAIFKYSLSRPIDQGETCTFSYTQSGNDIEDIAGNDLASFTDHTIVNGSTVQGATTYQMSLTVVGGGAVNSSQGGINCTAAASPCTKTCSDGTVLTFTPNEYNGWKTGSFSGTGCGETTTMSADRTCTYTFTPVYVWP